MRILVLQHPQEAKAPLGTARLLTLSLPGAVHKVGLSWRSLTAALGDKTPATPSEWGVLFLGTKKNAVKLPEGPVAVLDRTGKPMSPKALKGLILLDGNWKQSKTLWWRNPWLLKVNRVFLDTGSPSAYGALRKEPRKQCLSTLEAAGECLALIEGNTAARDGLKQRMESHLSRFSRS